MKRLYHYTSIEHLPLIVASGKLLTTESKVSETREHAGPDVVWLTSDPECAHGHGIGKSADGIDKSRIRFTVDVPNREVQRWKAWALGHGMDRAWLKTFTESAAQSGQSDGAGTWWVAERPVLSTRWVSVVDRQTGEELLPDSLPPSEQ